MRRGLFVRSLDRLNPQLVGVRPSEVARSLIAQCHASESYKEGFVCAQTGIAKARDMTVQLALDISDVRLRRCFWNPVFTNCGGPAESTWDPSILA